MSAVKAVVDFRSDTVTKPTQEMRDAMSKAEVGDDVYGEDPTIRRLEALGAQMAGKESAVFVPSGTMGNQVSILSWTGRGDEIILEEQAHIFMYEVGGPAVLSGVQARTIPGRHGVMDLDTLKGAIRKPNIHFPRTTLICLENTHNRSGGCILPLEYMKQVSDLARESGIAVHLDGARLFNAAVGLGVDAAEITGPVDSVQFCLSKGLCAPVGSLVAGPKDFVDRARKYRKLLGGGMRQAGILAAAGIVALEKMVSRLAEDHANAKLVAEALSQVPGLAIDMKSVQTNMVIVDIQGLGITGDEFAALMKCYGVLFNVAFPYRVRIVTHHDVSRQDCQEGIRRICEAVGSLRK